MNASLYKRALRTTARRERTGPPLDPPTGTEEQPVAALKLGM